MTATTITCNAIMQCIEELRIVLSINQSVISAMRRKSKERYVGNARSETRNHDAVFGRLRGRDSYETLLLNNTTAFSLSLRSLSLSLPTTNEVLSHFNTKKKKRKKKSTFLFLLFPFWLKNELHTFIIQVKIAYFFLACA